MLLLPLRKAEHEACKLLIGQGVIVCCSVLAHRFVDLFLREVQAVVLEANVELLHHLYRHCAAVVHVQGIEQLLDAVVRHRQPTDVVLDLFVGQVAVVVVAGNEAPLHGCERRGFLGEEKETSERQMVSRVRRK